MNSQPPEKPRHPLEMPPSDSDGDDVPFATMTAPRTREKRADEYSVPLPFVQPIFTYVILAINLLIFAADLYLFDGSLLESGYLTKTAVEAGEVWRMFTAMFLHFDTGHIMANSAALWIIGTQVERTYGYKRFLLVYLIAGLGGSAFGLLFYGADASAGASGAIEGLMGALLIMMLLNRRLFANPSFFIVRIIFSLIIQLAGATNIGGNTEALNIGYWAHLGGALFGILLAWRISPIYRPVFAPSGRVESIVDVRPSDMLWFFVGLSMLAILALSFIAIWLLP